MNASIEPLTMLVALAGSVLVGSVCVYAVHLVTRRRRDRGELRDGVSDFLAGCDQLWSAQSHVKTAVFMMTYVEGTEERARAGEARLFAIQDHDEANWKALRARDTIARLAPTLEDGADRFYATCDIGHGIPSDGPLPTPAETERRQSAGDAFLRSARHSRVELLDDPGRSSRWRGR